MSELNYFFLFFIIEIVYLVSLHKYIERVKYVDYLIRTKSTGNICVLAKKLNLSESGAEKFIHEMKEIGFPITYCKKEKTYSYEHDGKMVDKLFFDEMDHTE